MRTLTAAAEIAQARPYAEPLYLLQIDFTAPSPLTLRLSDAPRRALGEEWLPLVASWGTLEEVLNAVDAGGAPATAEIVLFNTMAVAGKARLSDLLRSPLNTVGTVEFAFAQATIYQVSAGLDAADALTLNVFYLEDPTEIGESLLRLRMSDRTLLLEDALTLTRVTRALFPSCAPAALDQIVPVPFGSLRGVEAIPLVDGAATRLSAAALDTDTSLAVEDASRFPAAGTVQVDVEHISYTSRTETALEGCTRGVNGTTASEHELEASVYEVRTSYRFGVVAWPPGILVPPVTTIRVNGRPALTGPTVEVSAIEGQQLMEIVFTPSDLAAFHTHPAGLPVVVSVSSIQRTGVGNISTQVAVPTGAEVAPETTRTMVFLVENLNAAATLDWNVKRKLSGGAFVTVASGTVADLPYAGSDTRTYPSLANEVIQFAITAGAGAQGRLKFTEYTVTFAGAGGGGDSTTAAVLGPVTCDVLGVHDDGTISGVPGRLLENPADIARFLLAFLYPGVRATDFGTRWAATRAALVPLRWAFLLGVDGPLTFSELRRRIGEQARSELFIEAGRFELRYLPDAPAADVVLDYLRDVWSGTPATVSRTTRVQLFNSVVASAGRQLDTGEYAIVVRAEDLTQPGLTDRLETALTFDFVQEQATAEALAAFWLRQWKRQRWQVDLVAWQNVLALEKGDHLAITNHPLLAAHGDVALVFRIIAKRYLLGDENPARIRLTAVEAGP